MSQLARDQRKARESRKLIAAVAAPELVAETAAAVDAIKRVEDRAAELLRERFHR